MTTTQNDLFDGYSIFELAGNLFASARRLMMKENEETYSAARALRAVRKDVYRPDQRIDLALDEALRLTERLGSLSSLDVLVAGEAIMNDRAVRS
jgi:hypothetical protein